LIADESKAADKASNQKLLDAAKALYVFAESANDYKIWTLEEQDDKVNNPNPEDRVDLG